MGVTFGAANSLGLHLGTSYSPRGATWLDGAERFTVRLDYFERMALARGRASIGGSTSGYLLAGPTLARVCEGIRRHLNEPLPLIGTLDLTDSGEGAMQKKRILVR